MLCHGPGPVKGQPIVLPGEAAQFLLDCHRIYPQGHELAGRRVVEFGMLSEPKGFAKSELAGAVSVSEFVGPCRFDHWAVKGETSPAGYQYEPGEPVCRTVRSPFVRALATEEGQTGNTYDNVLVMLEYAQEQWGNSEAGRFGDVQIGTTGCLLGRKGTDGKVLPSTSGSSSKDGGKETFCVEDEPHLYVLKELREMHDLVRSNSVKMASEEPWMLATSTMFKLGQGSVAEDLYDEAHELMAQPPHKRKHHAFCFLHREGYEVPVKDKENDEVLLASLSEAYAPVLARMDLPRIMRRMRARKYSWSEAQRYFCNVAVGGEDRAVDPAKWARLADPTRNPTGGENVVLWFDGAEKGQAGDHTVLGMWVLPEGEAHPHLVLCDWWESEWSDTDGEWSIPRWKIRRRVSEIKAEFNVVRFAADPPRWIEQIEEWQDEFGPDPFPGDGLVVIPWDTRQPTRMGPAITRFLEAVDEGSFTHDGSDQLTWYASNALLIKGGGRLEQPALAKPTQPEKIDGLVGAVLGYAAMAELPEMPEPVDLAMQVW